MKYFATLGGRQREVNIEALGGTHFRIRIDGGAAHEVDAERLDGGIVSLLVDGQSYDVDLEPDGEALNLLVRDRLFRMELLDERRLRLQAAKGGFTAAGPQVIRAPMPGKIVKVLAPEGTEVAEGQGVIVIEAMKMENELRATHAGKVAKVLVKEGQTVEGKTELVRIE